MKFWSISGGKYHNSIDIFEPKTRNSCKSRKSGISDELERFNVFTSELVLKKRKRKKKELVLTEGTEGCLVPGGEVGVGGFPDADPFRLRLMPATEGDGASASMNPALSYTWTAAGTHIVRCHNIFYIGQFKFKGGV